MGPRSSSAVGLLEFLVVGRGGRIGRAPSAGKDRRGWSSRCIEDGRRRSPLPRDGGGSGRWRPEPRGTTPTFGPTPLLGSRSSPTTPGRPHSTPASPRRRGSGQGREPPERSKFTHSIRRTRRSSPGCDLVAPRRALGSSHQGCFSTPRDGDSMFVDKSGWRSARLWTSPLCESVSNVHSESCPRGLTFTAEPTEGAIPGAVPGDRTDDRKAAGNGPGGGSTITSNRERRCASRRTVGPSGHFAVPAAPLAPDGKRWGSYRVASEAIRGS